MTHLGTTTGKALENLGEYYSGRKHFNELLTANAAS